MILHMSFTAAHPYCLEPLPPTLDLRDPDILELLVKAHKELVQLKGLTEATPNPLLLISPAILQESVASSEIENIHTTVVEVLQGQLFPEAEQKGPDKEVLRYQNAALWGNENLRSVALSSRLILGINRRLLQAKYSDYRKIQNKIENSRTKEVIYTPPIASSIPELLGNWENYVNKRDDEIDPLVKCAIAHYQFEAIHPFEDGNGRTGRILMVLSLVDQEILSLPILYVSGYLNNNRNDYYKLLLGVTQDKRWKEFIIFMLQAFHSQAIQTKKTLSAVLKLHSEVKDELKKKHSKLYDADLVDHLFSYPITTPARLAEALGTHQVTASKYLKGLKEAGFLKDRWHGKYHLFINDRLIKTLKT
jgi:Fic family protein